MNYKLRFKGGAGSGFHGHKGRPGEQGGSLPRDESQARISLTGADARRAHSMIGASNPNLKRFSTNKDGTYTYTSKSGREYDVSIQETSQGDRVKISRQGTKIADTFVPLQAGVSKGQFYVINRIQQFEDASPYKLRNVNAKISWDGKDVFELNNKIKRHFSARPETFANGTEPQFYDAVEKLLKRSGIELDDGQFDELGTYFDAWVPDKFEE